MIALKKLVKRIRSIRLGPKLAKSVGYGTLFSVLFSFFLVLSLPINRFTPTIESFLEGRLNRKVRIDNIATTLTGGVVLSNVEIGLGEREEEGAPAAETGDEEGAPASAKRPALTYAIDEIALDISFVSLLFDTLEMGADIDGLGGEIKLAYKGPIPAAAEAHPDSDHPPGKARSNRRAAAGRKRGDRVQKEDNSDSAAKRAEADTASGDGDTPEPVSIALNLADIQLRQVHDLRELLPVPISGMVNLDATLDSETSGLDKATGAVTFSLKDVVLSKSGYKADIMGSSLVVPALRIEAIDGEITFEEGIGKVTKFKMLSKHVEMGLEGTITLGEPLRKSQVDLYLTFKVKDNYLAESEAIKTLYSSLDLFSSKMKSAHRDDDFYGFRYRGVVGKGRFSPSKSFASSDGKQKKKKNARRRARTAKRAPRATPSVNRHPSPSRPSRLPVGLPPDEADSHPAPDPAPSVPYKPPINADFPREPMRPAPPTELPDDDVREPPPHVRAHRGAPSHLPEEEAAEGDEEAAEGDEEAAEGDEEAAEGDEEAAEGDEEAAEGDEEAAEGDEEAAEGDEETAEGDEEAAEGEIAEE